MGDVESSNNQYLTFQLGDDSLALDITRVREVLDLINITKIPRTPVFMLGVINLRGNVVPVIDLNHSLNMPPSQRTVDTCIIITECRLGTEQLLVGVLADVVQEVVNISSSELSPPPRMGVRFNPEFIRNLGRRGEDFITILNMDRILAENEVMEIGAMASLVPQGTANLNSSDESIQASQT